MGEMKRAFLLILITISLSCCKTSLTQKIGMTRSEWLGQTTIADQVYLGDYKEVWWSEGKYYYFRDGRLNHIDQGQLMNERFETETIEK